MRPPQSQFALFAAAASLGRLVRPRHYYPSIDTRMGGMLPEAKRELTDEDRRKITAAAEKRLRRATNRAQSKAAQLKS